MPGRDEFTTQWKPQMEDFKTKSSGRVLLSLLSISTKGKFVPGRHADIFRSMSLWSPIGLLFSFVSGYVVQRRGLDLFCLLWQVSLGVGTAVYRHKVG